jgi:hypothetical protein
MEAGYCRGTGPSRVVAPQMKLHVLTSGSLVANPKSGPDYSVFIMK